MLKLLITSVIFIAVVCRAETPAPAPHASAPHFVLRLSEPTPGKPVNAFIGEKRFENVAQLKQFIETLPRESTIYFRWYADLTGKNPFCQAAIELQKFSAERGIKFTVAPAGFL